jgi:hypothetical protein
VSTFSIIIKSFLIGWVYIFDSEIICSRIVFFLLPRITLYALTIQCFHRTVKLFCLNNQIMSALINRRNRIRVSKIIVFMIKIIYSGIWVTLLAEFRST